MTMKRADRFHQSIGARRAADRGFGMAAVQAVAWLAIYLSFTRFTNWLLPTTHPLPGRPAIPSPRGAGLRERMTLSATVAVGTSGLISMPRNAKPGGGVLLVWVMLLVRTVTGCL